MQISSPLGAFWGRWMRAGAAPRHYRLLAFGALPAARQQPLPGQLRFRHGWPPLQMEKRQLVTDEPVEYEN